MRTLFVANLGTKITEEDVRSAFERHGIIDSVQLARDPANGVSRGVAFVRISDDKRAAATVTAMTGSTIEGRSIRVSMISRSH